MNQAIRQLMPRTKGQPPMRIRNVSPNGAVLRESVAHSTGYSGAGETNCSRDLSGR
jgi:hypothetical protein